VRNDNRIFRPVRQSDHAQREGVDLEHFALALIDEPVASDERRFHDDLSGVPEPALRAESRRLVLALLLLGRPPAWAVARLSAIDAELGTRRRGR
jgi:hypothetical protein